MRDTIEVGLLYSRSGGYRLLSEACRSGALSAIERLNATADFPLTLIPVERDPGGNVDLYRPMCADILNTTRARHIIGCVTSWSRKEVIPSLERAGGILWYACPYEGFEASDHVVYAHACPNQHLLPLLAWAIPRFGGRGYLTGSNYIWGWETNRVARGVIQAAGGVVLGERYLPIGDTDTDRMIAEIRANRPDFVLNSLIGPSSYRFLQAYADLGRQDAHFTPATCPVLSCNLTECELPAIGAAAEGLIAAGPYFRPDGVTTLPGSSFEAAAHDAVLTLATGLARLADPTGAGLDEVLDAAASEGPLAIRRDTHHATLPVLIAQVRDGAFNVLSRQGAVPADPYLSRRDVSETGDAPVRRLRVVQ